MKERFLGVDYGEKRVGVALGVGGLARSLTTLENLSEPDLIKKILTLCQEEQIEELVVGLPLNEDGSESNQAKLNKAFGQRLQEAAGLPVQYWDESLTSGEALAEAIANGTPQKRRRSLDGQAAAIILQEFLEAQGSA
ncbi:MAG: Holliday junction resolvase RuvX [bacterium]|nr:Holliday junction resolvase RuvX [bacterium]